MHSSLSPSEIYWDCAFGSHCVLVTCVCFRSCKRNIQTYVAVEARQQTKAVLNTLLPVCPILEWAVLCFNPCKLLASEICHDGLNEDTDVIITATWYVPPCCLRLHSVVSAMRIQCKVQRFDMTFVARDGLIRRRSLRL